MTPAEMDRRRKQVRSINRLLCWVLPVVALGAGADFLRWRSSSNPPLRPLPPPLGDLTEALPEIPSVGLSTNLFQQPAPPPKPKEKEQPTQVAVQETQWKLKGVMLAGNRRAILEDQSGKSVWVTEGEQVGSLRVKEIRDGAVLMEMEGKEYEIRM